MSRVVWKVLPGIKSCTRWKPLRKSGPTMTRRPYRHRVGRNTSSGSPEIVVIEYLSLEDRWRSHRRRRRAPQGKGRSCGAGHRQTGPIRPAQSNDAQEIVTRTKPARAFGSREKEMISSALRSSRTGARLGGGGRPLSRRPSSPARDRGSLQNPPAIHETRHASPHRGLLESCTCAVRGKTAPPIRKAIGPKSPPSKQEGVNWRSSGQMRAKVPIPLSNIVSPSPCGCDHTPVLIALA